MKRDGLHTQKRRRIDPNREGDRGQESFLSTDESWSLLHSLPVLPQASKLVTLAWSRIQVVSLSGHRTHVDLALLIKDIPSL